MDNIIFKIHNPEISYDDYITLYEHYEQTMYKCKRCITDQVDENIEMCQDCYDTFFKILYKKKSQEFVHTALISLFC